MVLTSTIDPRPRRPPENRPYVATSKPANGLNQNKSSYNRRWRFRQAFFAIQPEEGLYWPGLDGGYGNAGTRPERRFRSGMVGGASRPTRQPFWRKAINPGSARAEPSHQRKPCSFTMPVQSWYASFEVRT